jgi:hypothetical protein
MATADVNSADWRTYLYVQLKGQTGVLYGQNRIRRFKKTIQKDIDRDSACEDTDCLFFDHGDGDMDLFICSGGNENLQVR